MVKKDYSKFEKESGKALPVLKEVKLKNFS